MIVETKTGRWFWGFTGQTDFQIEVLRCLFTDDEDNKIVYVGRVCDVNWKVKQTLFGERGISYTDTKLVNGRWDDFIKRNNYPTYCIIMWIRLTDKCKYVERKPKMKKDGTPRKISVKKNESINRLA